MLLSHFVVGMLSTGLAVLTGTVSGQDYPSKPIRIITFGAGSGSDFTSRQISQGISPALGQPVIVDNRVPIPASDAVAKSAPDGYTLLVGGANIWILPLLQKAPYDPSTFVPISLISREINVVTVHPSLPAKSIKELIALAKSRPGELNYGSGATGGPNHLAAELFKSMGGVNIVRVPFKSPPDALTAEISGEVQLTFFDAGPVMPHVKAGRLRALAITSGGPSILAPGLPTVAESGLPGYEMIGMTVIVAPEKTPAPVVTRLNQEIVRFLNQSGVKERFLAGGSEIVGSSPEQFASTMKAHVGRMAKVIRDASIKID